MRTWISIDNIDNFLDGLDMKITRKIGKRFYRISVQGAGARIWDDELKRISVKEVSVYDEKSDSIYMEINTLLEMEDFIKNYSINR